MQTSLKCNKRLHYQKKTASSGFLKRAFGLFRQSKKSLRHDVFKALCFVFFGNWTLFKHQSGWILFQNPYEQRIEGFLLTESRFSKIA